MIPGAGWSSGARWLACWNWKCALVSATARSLVYLAAMAHGGASAKLSVVLVEMAYVTLTSGVYAGMQQRALGLRSKALRGLTVVVWVPGLAQMLDWLIHRLAGASAPGKATLTVCVFACISALFHLHVMSRGTFLTGPQGRTLADDCRRMPRLIAEFAGMPIAFAASLGSRVLSRAAEPGI
jgi:hypothetical protein